jgi:hypothetical protein
MADTEPNATKRLALLIDGDNIRADYLPKIMMKAKEFGSVTIRRLYGQFADGKMKAWQKLIHDHALTPVQVSPATRGKNATDMKLVVDAMDMLRDRPLDGFVLVSSDSDFTTLASRIRESGLVVYGFGEKKAPSAYKAAFDDFIDAGDLPAPEKRQVRPKKAPTAGHAAPAATKSVAARHEAKPAIPIEAILAAIDEAADTAGWSSLGIVGKNVRKVLADFTPKKYGYGTMSDLIDKLPGVEMKRGEVRGAPVLVRRR